MGMDAVKALFFMLLNYDMPMKEYMIEPGDARKFAAAMNMKLQDSKKLHACSMLGVQPLPAERARLFYPALREVVKDWMGMEALNATDLVKRIREEYLVA